jgi:transposase InsO family protein
VIDLFTRECLAIHAGQGLGGQDVAATLERLRFERGLSRSTDRSGRVFECALVRVDRGRAAEINAFRWDYNEHCPHRAFKGLSPGKYAQRMLTTASDSPSEWS